MKIAIAGVTGAVGREFIKVLEKRKFPATDLVALASKRSVGKPVAFMGKEYKVRELTKNSFEGVEIAFFSAGGDRSLEFAPAAVEAGATVIDNSSAFRMDKNTPLVIPEINPDDVDWHRGIISNPNCTTIIALMTLAPIHRAAKITRFIVSSYQAVSGTGAAAMRELTEQLSDILAGRIPKAEVYPHQIAFNALPQVDSFLPNGYTKEEMKMVNETRKILHDDAIKATATCVRVPVMRSHSESIMFQTERPLEPEEVREILRSAPGVKVADDPGKSLYPLATFTTGQDDVYAGRIRKDLAFENGISMWVAGDQLLKGAALNAVQIGEVLLRKRGK
jgi:aspartate-semialdehyde dehydrogenase